METITKKELQLKLKALNGVTRQQRKEIACTLIGHSKIITTCFGYIHCARCDAQIGDSLGGVFDGLDCVIVNHECDTCTENWSKMTWQDKYLVKYSIKLN